MLNKIKKAWEAFNKEEVVPVHVGKEFNDKMDALGYGIKSIHSGGPCVDCGQYTHRNIDSENVYMCQQCFDELQRDIEEIRNPEADVRYKKPKEAPKASDKLVEETINDTEIYREAKERILKAQRKQVAYGLDKYPKPLSADVWDIYETIDHIIDEHVDGLHYIVMLQMHLKRLLEGPKMIIKSNMNPEDVAKAWEASEPGLVILPEKATYTLKDEYRGCDLSYDHDEGFTRVDGEPIDPDKHLKRYVDTDGDKANINFDDKPKEELKPGIIYQDEQMFVDGVKMFDITLDGKKVYTPGYFRMKHGFEPKFDPPKKKYSITPDMFEPRKFTVDLWVDKDDTIDDVLTSLKKALENTDWSV